MKKLSIIFLLFLFSLFTRVSVAQEPLTLLAELWGEEEEDQFISCASAGDVNGDGFMDVAVGTYSHGYLKIFLGGEQFDTIPDVRIVQESKGAFGDYFVFFFSVACAGDVNRDGYDDVIVGDPLGPFSMGQAYIYFGGDPMDTVADVVLKDSDFNYQYGWSVSSAGDVNRDGFDDVAVGAPTDHFDARGRVFIYFGGENMDSTADVYIEGAPYKGEQLGTSVTGIGDINGDRYDDVLVGAPYFGAGSHPIGRASIYFGGDPMDSTADVTFHGDSIEFLNFGRVIASAGDVNGDSIKDIIVGGVSYRVGLFSKVLGNPELEFDTLILVGEDTLPSAFGLSISTCGDLNKDGFDDVLVGDYQCGKELKGKAYIFYGGNPMDSLFDLVLIGDDRPGSAFSYRVAYAGDINGDGYNEIMVSSFGDSTRKGKVFVYTSKPTSVDEEDKKPDPQCFFLGQNYPNPFNSTTTIPFTVNSKQKTVDGPARVALTIYNILGQKVITLVDEMKPKGYYKIIWNGKDDSGKEVGSGIYLCQIKTEGFSEVRKIVLLK